MDWLWRGLAWPLRPPTWGKQVVEAELCLLSGRVAASRLERSRPCNAAVSPLIARLRRKGCQLEFVCPTGFVLGVEVIECLCDLHGIHHHLRVLLGACQSVRAWRVNEAVDHDVGHVYTMLGVFLRQHLG